MLAAMAIVVMTIVMAACVESSSSRLARPSDLQASVPTSISVVGAALPGKLDWCDRGGVTPTNP